MLKLSNSSDLFVCVYLFLCVSQPLCHKNKFCIFTNSKVLYIFLYFKFALTMPIHTCCQHVKHTYCNKTRVMKHKTVHPSRIVHARLWYKNWVFNHNPFYFTQQGWQTTVIRSPLLVQISRVGLLQRVAVCVSQQRLWNTPHNTATNTLQQTVVVNLRSFRSLLCIDWLCTSFVFIECDANNSFFILLCTLLLHITYSLHHPSHLSPSPILTPRAQALATGSIHPTTFAKTVIAFPHSSPGPVATFPMHTQTIHPTATIEMAFVTYCDSIQVGMCHVSRLDVATCCNVLQCVAVCCSGLQYVAMVCCIQVDTRQVSRLNTNIQTRINACTHTHTVKNVRTNTRAQIYTHAHTYSLIDARGIAVEYVTVDSRSGRLVSPGNTF